MDILEFIFSSFWIWMGTLILLVAPFAVLGHVISSARNNSLKEFNDRRKEKEPDN